MADSNRVVKPPQNGERITYNGGQINVPNRPIVPFIEGDGIGPDIWRATQRVLDGAVQKCYHGEREIAWLEILVGEKSKNQLDEWLPQESVDAISDYLVAIKGPLTTPVGGGIRSLNVSLRQILDLYACVRPCRYSLKNWMSSSSEKTQRTSTPALSGPRGVTKLWN